MDPVHVFKAAVDLAPERSEAFAGLAQAHELAGDWPLALKAWQRALVSDPDVAAWQLALGVAARKAGDLPKAAAALRKCIDLDLDDDSPSTTRAVRLLVRVLRAIVASSSSSSSSGSSSSSSAQGQGLVDRAKHVLELRRLVASLIERLERRLLAHTNVAAQGNLELDALLDNQPSSTSESSSSSSADDGETATSSGEGGVVVVAAVNSNSDGGSGDGLKKRRKGGKGGSSSSGSSAERIMAEVGALYVILGRLYLTPTAGDDAADGTGGTVSEEEEAQGVEAFRKGAAYAAYAAAHQPAAAAALAPLYEACGLGGTSAEKSAIKVCVGKRERGKHDRNSVYGDVLLVS
jgi:tetratricopeptide (TPR) repeat protein